MDDKKLFDETEKLALKLLQREDMAERGITLKTVKVAAGRNALIRVYIDKEGGVSIDDCSYFHREFSVLLDIENFMTGPYRLEVSSPGIDTK